MTHPVRRGVVGAAFTSAKTSAPLEERSCPAIDAIDEKSCRPDFAVLVLPAYLDDPAGHVAPDLILRL